eukprot:2015552-Pyramimonas_sp.AAC.1
MSHLGKPEVSTTDVEVMLVFVAKVAVWRNLWEPKPFRVLLFTVVPRLNTGISRVENLLAAAGAGRVPRQLGRMCDVTPVGALGAVPYVPIDAIFSIVATPRT